MAATKTAAENGGGKKTQQQNVLLQRIHPSDETQPRRAGGPFPAVFYWVVGLIVGGVVMAVVMCTAAVYKQRLDTLQGRVDALEQHCLGVETTLKNYVDETLRSLHIQQQVREMSLQRRSDGGISVYIYHHHRSLRQQGCII